MYSILFNFWSFKPWIRIRIRIHLKCWIRTRIRVHNKWYLMPLICLITCRVLLKWSRSLQRAIERQFLLLPLLFLRLMTGGLGARDSLAGLHKHHPVLALRNKFSSSEVGGYVRERGVAKLKRWVAKLKRWVLTAKLKRWVAQLKKRG
jgi:hypothetical protein